MTIRTMIGVAALTAVIAGSAQATSLFVANASFETIPAGGLNESGCGVGCSYNGGTVPGWSITGDAGELQPGSSSGNVALFNSVPDGMTVAFSNGGTLSQTLADTVVAGATYVFTVDVGQRNDLPLYTPTETLFIGGTAVAATGGTPDVGGWTPWTATYVATAADAGKSLEIQLASNGIQGNWDNVSVSETLPSSPSAVPEPAGWALMLVGLGGVGGVLRGRRRSGSGPETVGIS